MFCLRRARSGDFLPNKQLRLSSWCPGASTAPRGRPHCADSGVRTAPTWARLPYSWPQPTRLKGIRFERPI